MKIQSIEFRMEDLRLAKPYRIAFKTIDFVENLYVYIRFTNGITGYGSCNPENEVAYISREKTLAASRSLDLEMLRHIDYAEPGLLIADLLRMIGSVPTLAAALEMAVWDAWAKSMNCSVAHLWGQKIEPLATSVTIGIMDIQQTVSEAHQYLNQGFRYLKIKIGLDVEQDLERIARLHEVFRDTIIIRADINQGYRLDDFRKFWQKSKPFQIELFEQPLRRDQFHEVDQLDPAMRRQLAADESLLSLPDARDLADHKRCGIFNIKLMKCGGFTQVRSIADLAADHEIDLMWGCNDESVLSITAAMYMAYSFPHTKYLDLDGSFDLAVDLAKGGFRLENGRMIPTGGVGLGVSLLDD
jgi:L-Ala-D/L-Glu epimerase